MKKLAATVSQILLVEDSPTQALHAKLILAQDGHEVTVVGSGEEALTWLDAADTPPDVIVSDVVMPGIDGYELCRRIKADDVRKAIPVILLTTLGDPTDIVVGLSAGADNFLTKPVDAAELLSRVQYILANRRLRSHIGGSDLGISIHFGGRTHFINSERIQLIDHLLSTYERTVDQNRELSRANRELKRLHEELVDKNAVLAQLNEEKNQLLGIAAHDIRNPLGVIGAYAQFLIHGVDDDSLSARQVGFVEKIRDMSDFMLRLVEDLLDLSKVGSGSVHLNVEEVALGPLLEQNVALNRALAQHKGTRIALDMADLPVALRADRTKIEQVLNNLIGNAVKFSPSGALVDVRAGSVGPDRVFVSVHDEGPGIPADQLSDIFRPFERGTSGADDPGGAGLGLAIVHRIVEGHGGTISVESQPGLGSTFRVELPLEPAA